MENRGVLGNWREPHPAVSRVTRSEFIAREKRRTAGCSRLSKPTGLYSKGNELTLKPAPWQVMDECPIHSVMKPSIMLCFALVLCGVLFGCAHAPKAHLITPATYYAGQEFEPPRKMRNGSASLKDVYAWANSLLGTNYSLETIHADVFHDGNDVLFVAQPSWGGTGGNDYLAFRQTPKGWRFLGDIWFGGIRVLSPDPEGRPRILTSSSAGGGRCNISLYVLERNGFHETMTRKNLPCGDPAHAEGQDRPYDLLFDSKTVTQESLQLVFGDPATVDFSGSLKAGKRFERTFGGRFIFSLEPIDSGWEIRIYKRRRTENIARLTPPFHSVANPRYIEGWNFRNENNAGPNHGSVNAPQKRREFIFSPEVGNTIDGPQARYGVTPGEVDRVEAFGRGDLEITHLKLSPPHGNENARILAMEFRCKFVWRQKPLEEITTDTVHT